LVADYAGMYEQPNLKIMISFPLTGWAISLATCKVVGGRVGCHSGPFDQLLRFPSDAVCAVCNELWYLHPPPPFSYSELSHSGPRKTIRPITHHYVRLVTDVDPADIPEINKNVKLEETMDSSMEGSSIDDWTKDQRWYKKNSMIIPFLRRKK